MRFLRPDLAIWLLAMPLAFGAWYLHVYAKGRFRTRAAIAGRVRRLSRFSSRTRDWLMLMAALATIACVTIAMMRPQVLLERQTPEYDREDLILILDRSVSMRAEDIEPSRFGRAITEIKAFLSRKPEAIDRIGLVGFSGTALVISHLTRDPNSLFFYLDYIQEDGELRFGTDIGAALSSARDLARKDPRPTRKILLILSDGDEQGEELQSVVAALRHEGTPVYAIGIGSDQEVPIPVRTAEGRKAVLQDERGRPLYTRFNERTLRDIATVTGGRYYRSTTGSELVEAMQAVVERERRLAGWKTSIEYRDLYREFLAAGAAAALLLLLTL